MKTILKIVPCALLLFLIGCGQPTVTEPELVIVNVLDKEYHDDLFSNIITYIYGCEFGIAVFERLESNNFNPNVSLEVGFLLGLKKKVCFLKDKTINVLHTDLVGKLYRPFDPQDPENTIKEQLLKWLEDKNLI